MVISNNFTRIWEWKGEHSQYEKEFIMLSIITWMCSSNIM